MSASHQQQQPRQIDHRLGLAAWDGVKYLTDRERDEIDFGVKVALRKSVDRVRELEAVEKGALVGITCLSIVQLTRRALETARVIHAKRENPNAGLTRFLGLSGPSAVDAAAALASHRTYVTLHLNNMLAAVSKYQRDQQEARIKRVLDKTATLDGLGGGGAQGMDEYGQRQADKAKADHAAGKGKGKEGNQVGQVPSIYRPNPPQPAATASADGLGGSGTGDETDLLDVHDGLEELTQEMIQQFEAEESALLQATHTDLASLKLAESSLLEISALQSQLAMHLTQQGELTDKLWEEAVGVAGKVDEGNTQLKKAKERNRESRIILLVFLLMCSFSLLFLDYYSS